MPARHRQPKVEGRIFIQFTVMPDGTLQDGKVVKGIGFGCDDEAIRVLALTKWKPGRQGGGNVAVRMIQPIVSKMP
ncbi:MAG: energy transducer TonB [Bacteroidota bacterium]